MCSTSSGTGAARTPRPNLIYDICLDVCLLFGLVDVSGREKNQFLEAFCIFALFGSVTSPERWQRWALPDGRFSFFLLFGLTCSICLPPHHSLVLCYLPTTQRCPEAAAEKKANQMFVQRNEPGSRCKVICILTTFPFSDGWAAANSSARINPKKGKRKKAAQNAQNDFMPCLYLFGGQSRDCYQIYIRLKGLDYTVPFYAPLWVTTFGARDQTELLYLISPGKSGTSRKNTL